ncbi:hypothetical protein FVEG_16544 [Fusarium verticillioides 7600]|uniref:Uncharacterized protein n=1 Tax=Gibberella moniliformis (strain M3125 / FGSC 7600) TaxID=334819 RepID=W7MG94_GIBM7|nr:hypothetical protein FVEG_16544 [Fusarium verticillioides 7600]EWG49881.1 hypothetical protein FVEG_16544 [Fusarium verticillioides 7600]
MPVRPFCWRSAYSEGKSRNYTVQYTIKIQFRRGGIGNTQLKVGVCLVADLQCHQFHFQRQCRPFLEASGGSQMQMWRGLFSAHAHCFPREQPGRYVSFGLSIAARYLLTLLAYTLSQAIA